jgi:hypothetical protein
MSYSQQKEISLKYFIYGDRSLSVYHARIKNECSNLNADLCKIIYEITPIVATVYLVLNMPNITS